MATQNPTGKKALIEKANTTVVLVTSIAAFVIVFCLVASKTLISQMSYQSRVTDAKSAALNQIKADATSANDLISSYQAFVSTPQNVLGGNPSGTGAQDGDNGQIILDALPDKYDFPALATTLEKILTGQTTQNPTVNVQVSNISGTDNALSPTTSALIPGTSITTAGSAVAIPFQVSVIGDYGDIQNLIYVFEHSIRPFQIDSLQFSGSQSQMTLSLNAHTYYQPATTFSIGTKVVQ
jgi:hypothetical protein